MSAVPQWRADVLGAPFEQLALPLGTDDEGPVVATLVRHRARWPARSARGPASGTDVLYVHGWSDYFFQRQLAEFWTRAGARFFALDLRKYGRSLRPGQTPGYVTDLAAYDEDIEAALQVMGRSPADRRPARRLVLMGHSTGGLTLSLWAARHPGRASALVLNSPWLEFQAHGAGRILLTPFATEGARRHPRDPLPQVDLGFYTRTVSSTMDGEWDYDLGWRPARGFAVRPAWLSAVLAGHAAVARGLHIDTPVLTLLSARSTIQPRWSEAMRHSDIVLDVAEVARRALGLGTTVTVDRIDGALHDVVLSAPEVRAVVYTHLARWLRGYVSEW